MLTSVVEKMLKDSLFCPQRHSYMDFGRVPPGGHPHRAQHGGQVHLYMRQVALMVLMAQMCPSSSPGRPTSGWWTGSSPIAPRMTWRQSTFMVEMTEVAELSSTPRAWVIRTRSADFHLRRRMGSSPGQVLGVVRANRRLGAKTLLPPTDHEPICAEGQLPVKNYNARRPEAWKDEILFSRKFCLPDFSAMQASGRLASGGPPNSSRWAREILRELRIRKAASAPRERPNRVSLTAPGERSEVLATLQQRRRWRTSPFRR